MVKGVILTDRDRALLFDCYEAGFLSFYQVKGRHFAEISRATTHNRLTRLKEDGYLKSVRVGRVIHHQKPQEIGVVYQVTKKAIEVLAGFRTNRCFRKDPVRLNTGTLLHDLVLTDALTTLKAMFPDRAISPGRLHPVEGVRIPDGIILDSAGKPHVAVELELTPKSEKRYREIILHYAMTPQFPKVLYIVENKEVLEKVRGQVLGYRPNPSLPAPSTGKFYFVTKRELLNGTTTNATNGETNLTVS